MSKERLLVAGAAEVQLRHAVELITSAINNLQALKFGVQPALDTAQKAFASARTAHKMTQELIERIPVQPEVGVAPTKKR